MSLKNDCKVILKAQKGQQNVSKMVIMFFLIKVKLRSFLVLAPTTQVTITKTLISTNMCAFNKFEMGSKRRQNFS